MEGLEERGSDQETDSRRGSRGQHVKLTETVYNRVQKHMRNRGKGCLQGRKMGWGSRERGKQRGSKRGSVGERGNGGMLEEEGERAARQNEGLKDSEGW